MSVNRSPWSMAALLLMAGSCSVAHAAERIDDAGGRWRIAQTAPPAPAPPPASPQAAPPAASPQAGMAVSLEQALYLIRSTLLTLNDANRSGNYTVLRDLASPDIQSANNAADLAQHFAALRQRNFDLYAAAITAPQLAAAPRIENKMLRLTGSFASEPQQINFDLLYQNISDQWRLFGISVQTPQASARQPTAALPGTPAVKSAPLSKSPYDRIQQFRFGGGTSF